MPITFEELVNNQIAMHLIGSRPQINCIIIFDRISNLAPFGRPAKSIYLSNAHVPSGGQCDPPNWSVLPIELCLWLAFSYIVTLFVNVF